MNIGKLAAEREPDLNLRRASPARPGLLYGRDALIELLRYCILLCPVPMRRALTKLRNTPLAALYRAFADGLVIDADAVLTV